MKIFVSILMGSDSDLPIMQEAAKVLEQLGVESEVRVLSAHRVPTELAAYIHSAVERGCKVFIGGAGVAAALPGTIAAHTSLPVIGVPLTSANSAAGGLDSMLSIVQMPPGVPVAAVGLNGAKNAGILAAQIVAGIDEAVSVKVIEYKKKLASDVLAKDEKLQEKGFKKYLEDQGLI